MKLKLKLIGISIFGSGVVIGYIFFRMNWFAENSKSLLSIPESIDKRQGFGEKDMAFLIRAYDGSLNGKKTHQDRAIRRHLVEYYKNRMSLSEVDREALNANALLDRIKKIGETDLSLGEEIRKK